MNKILLTLQLFLSSSFFIGCSHFTINATICDQIASDPLATVPQECRIYNEDEAEKSFHNTHNQNTESNESIEFKGDK